MFFLKILSQVFRYYPFHNIFNYYWYRLYCHQKRNSRRFRSSIRIIPTRWHGRSQIRVHSRLHILHWHYRNQFSLPLHELLRILHLRTPFPRKSKLEKRQFSNNFTLHFHVNNSAPKGKKIKIIIHGKKEARSSRTQSKTNVFRKQRQQHNQILVQF